MGNIRVITEDITRLRVDAIINAANSSLLGGSGVDGAIHRAAGPELLNACKRLGGCPTGEARVTPGFNLPARWVIHTVGPIWQGGTSDEARLLKNCYISSMEQALLRQARTIAFPAISTGAFGYPKQAAAEIAIEAMSDYENYFDEIIACCFNLEDAELYQQALLSINNR